MADMRTTAILKTDIVDSTPRTALQELSEKSERICERYCVGLSIGVHKGNLIVIRSYVYGDDIHTTFFLSGFDRSYESKPDEIWVIASRKIVEEMKSLLREAQILELESSRFTGEPEKTIFQKHGACRLLIQRKKRIAL